MTDRIAALQKAFDAHFPAAEGVRFFSCPGRTEIIGNHTDHNGGRILAAAIGMETVCAAALSDDDTLTLISEGHPNPVVISITDSDRVPKEQGSLSLVAGMIDGALKKGWPVRGLNIYVTSTVIPSAGVSSSASFEMMVLTVLDHFFNGGRSDLATRARIGQYAENVFWNKASGLMDQMACAAGGTILLDFSDGVSYEPVDFDYERLGYDLVIVNTGKGHADLSKAYSSIPNEMRLVAAAFDKKNLCEVAPEAFYENLPRLRKQIGNDRAILRAMHYFAECARVDAAAAAVKAGRFEDVLRLIEESGHSSWEILQNCVVEGVPAKQPIPTALSLTRRFLETHDCGVTRIHGGGFAGVIMTVVKKEYTRDYIDYMTPFFGADNIYPTAINPHGAREL